MPAPFRCAPTCRKPLSKVFRSCLLALLALPVQADDLMQVFTLALEHDPALAEARERYAAEHTLLDQNRANFLPRIELSGTTSRNAQAPTESFSYDQGFNAHSYRLSLTQNLLNVQNWYGWQSAKSNDQRALASLMQAEQDLILRVARAYFDVLRSEEALAAFTGEEEAAAAVLNQVTQRFDVGLAAVTDVNEAQANHDMARVNRLREERNLNQRRLALEEITGRQHDNLDTLSGDFPIESPQPAAVEDWVGLAADNSPALHMAEAEFEARKQDAKAARAAHLPTLSVSASYNDSAESRNPFSFFPGTPNTNASVSLSVSIPLYTGGVNSARMRQAYHQRDASEYALERVRRENERNTRDSFVGVEMDVLSVAARRQAIVSTQSALEAVQAGADVGTRNTVDVVQAQRSLFNSMRDLANARYDYVIDTLLLKQAAGVLTPEDIRALNDWLE